MKYRLPSLIVLAGVLVGSVWAPAPGSPGGQAAPIHSTAARDESGTAACGDAWESRPVLQADGRSRSAGGAVA